MDGLASPLVIAVKSILEQTVADEIDEDGLQWVSLKLYFLYFFIYSRITVNSKSDTGENSKSYTGETVFTKMSNLSVYWFLLKDS